MQLLVSLLSVSYDNVQFTRHSFYDAIEPIQMIVLRNESCSL